CDTCLNFGAVPDEILALAPVTRRMLSLVRLRAGPFRKENTPASYLHFKGSARAQTYDFSGTLGALLSRDSEVQVNRTALKAALRWLMANNPFFNKSRALAETLHAYFPAHRSRDSAPVGTPFVTVSPDDVELRSRSQKASKVGQHVEGLLMADAMMPPESRAPQNAFPQLVAGEQSLRDPPADTEDPGVWDNKDACKTIWYGDRDLEAMLFVELFPSGRGHYSIGAYQSDRRRMLRPGHYVQARLCCPDGRFRDNSCGRSGGLTLWRSRGCMQRSSRW